MKDLIQLYEPEQTATYLREALKACDMYYGDEYTTFGEAIVSACCYGLSQKEDLETLRKKYKKAIRRLQHWGDVQFVSDLEEGKV